MAGTSTLYRSTRRISVRMESLTDWDGYFKYQEAASAVELLREEIAGARDRGL